MTLEVVPFSYTGDGNNDRVLDIAALSGLDFAWTPQLVIIKRENQTSTMVWRSTSMPSGTCYEFVGNDAQTTSIKSFGAAAVTIGTDSKVNTSGAPYNGIALYSSDGAHLREGSYVGDGNDSRNISIGDSWTPDFVNVKRGDTSGANFRTSNHSGDSSGTWNGTHTTNRIQAFGAGTFQVGTDANVNSASGTTTYYWFALRDFAGVMGSFAYTGDGADDRSLAPLGFTPDAFAFTKGSNQNAAGVVRFAGHTGDESQAVNGTTTVGLIQSFITNGIQVGNSGNANTGSATYTGFALKASVIEIIPEALITTAAVINTINTRDAASAAVVSIISTRSVSTEAGLSTIAIQNTTTEAAITAPISVSVASAASILTAATKDVTTAAAVSDAASVNVSSQAAVTHTEVVSVSSAASIAEPIVVNVASVASISAVSAGTDVTTAAEIAVQASRSVNTAAATNAPATRQVTTAARITTGSVSPPLVVVAPSNRPRSMSVGAYIYNSVWPRQRLATLPTAHNIDYSFTSIAQTGAKNIGAGNCDVFAFDPAILRDPTICDPEKSNLLVFISPNARPWVGFISTLEEDSTTKEITISAFSYEGVFDKRQTPQNKKYEDPIGSGAVDRNLVDEGNARAHMGLRRSHFFEIGPIVEDLPVGGQTIMEGRNENTGRNNYEWWLDYVVTAQHIEIITRFGFRQGYDLSASKHFYEGVHFSYQFRDDVSQVSTSSTAIGDFVADLPDKNSVTRVAEFTPTQIGLGNAAVHSAPERVRRTVAAASPGRVKEAVTFEVMTGSTVELDHRSSQRMDRPLASHKTYNVQFNSLVDWNDLAIGNYVTLHAIRRGEAVEDVVRIMGLQPNAEGGQAQAVVWALSSHIAPIS